MSQFQETKRDVGRRIALLNLRLPAGDRIDVAAMPGGQFRIEMITNHGIEERVLSAGTIYEVDRYLCGIQEGWKLCESSRSAT